MNKIFFIGCLLIVTLLYNCNSSKDYVENNDYAVIRITGPIKGLGIEDLVGDYDLIKLEALDNSCIHYKAGSRVLECSSCCQPKQDYTDDLTCLSEKCKKSC